MRGPPWAAGAISRAYARSRFTRLEVYTAQGLHASRYTAYERDELAAVGSRFTRSLSVGPPVLLGRVGRWVGGARAGGGLGSCPGLVGALWWPEPGQHGGGAAAGGGARASKHAPKGRPPCHVLQRDPRRNLDSAKFLVGDWRFGRICSAESQHWRLGRRFCRSPDSAESPANQNLRCCQTGPDPVPSQVLQPSFMCSIVILEGEF